MDAQVGGQREPPRLSGDAGLNGEGPSPACSQLPRASSEGQVGGAQPHSLAHCQLCGASVSVSLLGHAPTGSSLHLLDLGVNSGTSRQGVLSMLRLQWYM